jgi:glycosyltransferase involved in cell wall biosynthesis
MSGVPPTVSVVMVVHNGGRFLRPAVDSVLRSMAVSLELVLIDNASTDQAVDALPADARLKIVRRPTNLGIPAGTNEGMCHVRGDFVAIVDQDDRVYPARFARQLAWLQAHADCVGVASRTVLIDEHDRRIGGDFTLHGPMEHREFTRFSPAACFGSHLWRREVIDLFPRRAEFPFSSDFDFVARVNDTRRVAALPEELFEYRVHPDQTTRRRRHEQVAAEIAIRLLTAQRRRGEAEAGPRVQEWLNDSLRLADVPAVYRAGLRVCRDFAEPELAVYHARRLLGVSRTAVDMRAAVATTVWALRIGSHRSRPRLARLFLRGPLRTFHLNPWPHYA